MSSHNSSGAGLRLAAAALNIAKGTAIGGLPGAAAGAVKSFLPEIIKAAVIIITVLIVLPVLIFSALPNIFFGFDNAHADDVIMLTEQARRIDAAYRDVQNFRQAEVDRIVASATAAHDADEVAVNTDLGNTNIYWFIAITSVAHMQDLFSMDEESIRGLIIRKIIHSTSILESIVGEDDAATVIRTLQIDINDMNPEELMDELGFTDEARNWARVLYSTMTEEQYMGIADSDGPGSFNVDFGDITFTDASTPVVYFSQFDSRWGNLPFGITGTIGSSGCGPTSLAMVNMRTATITD